MMNVKWLKKNKVVDISMHVRFSEDPDDSRTFRGYWTGEIDIWGKYTIIPVGDGHANYIVDSQPLYLFADEIDSVEDI